MTVGLEQISAVVLAGGLGTRVKSLYPDLPKPMISVSGRPFVEWVLRYLSQQGIGRALLSCGYKAEAFANHFKGQAVPGLVIRCLNEQSPQGTAGGFLEAVAQSQESPEAWLVVNGDSLVLANLKAATQFLSDPVVKGGLVGAEVTDTSRYGRIIFDETGRLLRFEEKRPGHGVINAGMYVFKPELLAQFPRQRPVSFETEVFPSLLSRQVHLQVSVTNAPFLDIGTPESLALAEDFIRQNAKHFG